MVLVDRGDTMLRVKLLDVSANAEKLLFAAGRQCYSEGWVGDSWQEDEDGFVSITDNKDGHLCTDKEIEGLINHLFKSGHTSVLEHVKFTFAIDGISRADSHQHVRHRMASYSQQSQRYVANGGEFDINNFVIPPSINKHAVAKQIYIDALEYIQQAYNELKELSIKSEDARYLMPNAAITRLVTTKNCVSLIHFFGLRCCTLAQWEIRNVANEMLALCKEALPVVFKNVGPKCQQAGYCSENKARSCGKYPTKEEVLAGYTMWKTSLEKQDEE